MAIDIADFASNRPFPRNAHQPLLLGHAHEAGVIGTELSRGRIVQMRESLHAYRPNEMRPSLRTTLVSSSGRVSLTTTSASLRLRETCRASHETDSCTPGLARTEVR
jgi:hypothetical protein